MVDGKIDYQILEDGTCSYCGKQAGLIPLFDGNLVVGDACIPCECYNAALEFEERWSNRDSNDDVVEEGDCYLVEPGDRS